METSIRQSGLPGGFLSMLDEDSPNVLGHASILHSQIPCLEREDSGRQREDSKPTVRLFASNTRHLP